MIPSRAYPLALAASALFLCAAAPAPSPEAGLMAADRAFSKLSVEKGRPFAFLAFMANDGRLYGTGSDMPVYGKADAFRRMGGGREAGTLSWEPETAHVSADGRLGWTDGHWLYVVKGSRQRSTGHYLTVWAKDRRGAWKVAADMGTSDTPRK
jgi:ketosteroid isomerase-like protein